MKFKIYITNNAQKNLEEILNYIKLESKSRAQSLLIAIKEKILSLKSNPRRGRKVPEYNGEKEIREIIFGSYRIIYEIERDQIFILFVYHGARLLRF